jgi:hypothetical protein
MRGPGEIVVMIAQVSRRMFERPRLIDELSVPQS